MRAAQVPHPQESTQLATWIEPDCWIKRKNSTILG